MLELLKQATIPLRSFLERSLPLIKSNWWESCVLTNLTESQRRVIAQRNITSLAGLDLAALLRIFDTNFYDIETRLTLPRECRNWLKEMVQVRNRWAHHTGEAEKPDNLFRDLDTLERFLTALDEHSELVEEIQKNKRDLWSGLGANNGAQAPNDPIMPNGTIEHIGPREITSPVESKPDPLVGGTKFAEKQMVRLKANPAEVGPILSIIPGTPQNRYQVYLPQGKLQSFYEDQLEAEEALATIHFSPLSEFRARLTALYLQNPGIATLYSLHAAKVDYIPYQFRPVIKFIRSDRPRLLVADEVGVGKTIEAGLILRELQARKNLRSVLVICPKALVTDRKWERDLRRFDERFTQLDSRSLRYCFDETNLDGEWPDNHSKTIIPFSVFDEQMVFGKNGSKGLLELDPPPKFDLVIVDEAHHLRNPGTYLHQAVKFFVAHAEAAVFLSATPVQLGSNDLFVLLNLLRPDVVIDQEAFSRMSEPNPHINEAVNAIRKGRDDWQRTACSALENACSTPWGEEVLSQNPDVLSTLQKLSSESLNMEERVGLIKRVEDFHTFSRFLNRTRRRDIGDFTKRKSETVTVAFTAAQKQLHDKLLDAQAALLKKSVGSVNVRFMMTTIRRRAASCLHALVPFLNDILEGRLVSQEDELGGEDEQLGQVTPDSELRSFVAEVLEEAKYLPPEDPKLEALMKIVSEKLGLSNNKLLLFSTFQHTLNYLHSNLIGAGIRCGLMLGKTSDHDRVQLRRRFALPKDDPEAIDVLLSSEIGCEGLDYQFCDCMVNYDLPWNPMRVEQRIGRIDRYGQKSEAIAIYNLITPGTVDADIYERCLLRIGIFERSIGASEEILGELTTELHNVAENLSLSQEERQAQLEKIAENKVLKLQEEMAMEENQHELFGIRPPSNQSEREDQKSANLWVSPAFLANLVSHYLKFRCGVGEYLLGEKDLKTLRLNEEARKLLRDDLLRLNQKKSVLWQDWAAYLKGGNAHIAVTFNPEAARENPGTMLLTPIHPLILQASTTLLSQNDLATAISIESSSIPPGKYPFIIYQWKRIGLRNDIVFQPVCAQPDLVSQFESILELGHSVQDGTDLGDESTFEALEAVHYQLFTNARAAHKNHEKELMLFQKTSLQTSHAARVAHLQNLLATAENPKIKLMRESELKNAETDYKIRIDEMNSAAEQADILAQPVAKGIIVIKAVG